MNQKASNYIHGHRWNADYLSAFGSMALLLVLFIAIIRESEPLDFGITPPAIEHHSGCVLLDWAPVIINVTKDRRVFFVWGDSLNHAQLLRAVTAQHNNHLSAEQLQLLVQYGYIGIDSRTLPTYFSLLAAAQSKRMARGMAFDSAMHQLRTFTDLAGIVDQRLTFCLYADPSLSMKEIHRIGQAIRHPDVRNLYFLTGIKPSK